jgi:putative ABC transport system substrate-binding protein
MGLAGHRRGTEVDPLIAEDRAILARGRRGDRIKRREFIALIGIGGAAAWPLAAGAQQAMPVDSSSADEYAPFLAAFRAGLGEAGFVQGHNVAVEYRWAEGHYDRLPALALELVRHPVAVLVATGITAARAARAETSTIPIVFNTGGDPVRFGLVASLNRPGGNVTGVASLGKVLVAKRFELLRELVPKADTIAYLVNPNNAVADLDSNDAQSAAAALVALIYNPETAPYADLFQRPVEAAAPAFAVMPITVAARSAAELESAVDAFARTPTGGLLVLPDVTNLIHRDQIIALAARHRLPAVYPYRYYAASGGLLSYGSEQADVFRRAASYVDRILKGTSPGELPVQAPTDQPPLSGPVEYQFKVGRCASVAGGAGRRSAAGHAANAGTNTSGAGGLYPIEA